MRTFRTWVLSMCAVLLPVAALAGPLHHFQIEAPASVPAGSIFGVTITGQDAGSVNINDFFGTVSLSASSGAGTISPTVSGNFSGSPSQWVGGLRIYTAGSITVTCSTGGTLNATGTALINVTPLSQVATLMVFQGQTYTPGLAPGYAPITPTAYEGIPYSVTIYTVDQYFNWSTYSGPIDLMNDAGTVNGLPNADEVSTTDGHAIFTIKFTDVAASNYFTLYSTKPRSYSKQVYVFKTGQAYLHAFAPAVVTAGVSFPLRVTASASNTDPSQIVASLTAFDTFRFTVFQAATGDPATGTWEPTDPKGLAGGVFAGQGSYTRAELILIRGEQVSSTITLYGLPRYIDVLPNLPAAVQVSVAPGRVQSQHAARVSALVQDAYGNPTRSSLHPFVVVFDLVPVDGKVNGYLSTTVSPTDTYGYAYCDYTAGIENGTATVRARAWNSALGYEYASGTADVRISVAQAQAGSILNFPNPFHPLRNETTAINYYLDNASDVDLRIYDPFGRLVLAKDLKIDGADLVSRNATAQGGNTFVWDGKNGEGRVVANGIYLVKLKARGGGVTQEFTRRVGVIK